MIKQLSKTQHTIAYVPKTQEDYQAAVKAMESAGFASFMLSGFDGESFVGYSPSLSRGQPKFTDGTTDDSLSYAVLYVDTIQDLVDTSKNELENFDPVKASNFEQEVIKSMLTRILGS